MYIYTDTKNKSNPTHEEKKAMQDLQQRDDIIITNNDKGRAIVIQDVKDYIHKANRQLQNRLFYKQTNMDLTIDELQKQNLFSQKHAQHLKVEHSQTPKFYTLLKIHMKDTVTQEDLLLAL